MLWCLKISQSVERGIVISTTIIAIIVKSKCYQLISTRENTYFVMFVEISFNLWRKEKVILSFVH